TRLQDHEGVVVLGEEGPQPPDIPAQLAPEEGSLEEVLDFLGRHQGRHVRILPGTSHAKNALARQYRQLVTTVRPRGRLGLRVPDAGYLPGDVGVCTFRDLVMNRRRAGLLEVGSPAGSECA